MTQTIINLSNQITREQCQDFLSLKEDYQLHHDLSKTHLVLAYDKLELLEKTVSDPKAQINNNNNNNFFDDNTEIILYNCTTKKISNIQEGDTLLGSDNYPIVVKKIIKNKDPMYRISTDKGIKYTVNGDYILLLKATKYESISWDKIRKRYLVRWLQNYAIKEKYFSIGKYGRDYGITMNKIMNSNLPLAIQDKRQNSIEAMKNNTLEFCKQFLNDIRKMDGYVACGDIIQIKIKDYTKLSSKMKSILNGFIMPINFPESELEIDPYILGYWLGSSSKNTIKVFLSDSKIMIHILDFTKANDLCLCSKKNNNFEIKADPKIDNITKNMFNDFLIKHNMKENKYIPIPYLKNSKENRLQLLAGIIDSYTSTARELNTESESELSESSFNLKFKSKKLANNVLFLARSLGFKAKKINKKSMCKVSIDKESINCLPLLSNNYTNKNSKNIYLTNIKVSQLPTNDCYGLVVDRNERFLLSDFTLGQNAN